MVTYIIKSTACLLIFYGFFHFYLRPYKILIFNRYFLISSLILSLIIPLIIIPVKTDYTVTNNLDKLIIPVGKTLQIGAINEISVHQSSYQNIIPVLYIIISSVLLIRYLVNIFIIIRKTHLCKKIENTNTTLILVEEKTLPYSFFKYIFVNKSDFENGRINKELLLHEETHCLQYHSFDIILLELIHVFFWFNPTIWLFKKSILLNHEYTADNYVIADNATSEYQQILLNLVIQNNANTLVSHIKNSFIKNRLIMMTSNESIHNAILRKIAGVTLILFIGVVFTLCQVDKSKDDSSKLKSTSSLKQDINSADWWKSIANAHGINYNSYTVYQQFVIFGDKTINGDIESFTNVVAISKSKNGYVIYKSKTASYDNKNKLLEINDCSYDSFKWDSNLTEPAISLVNMNYRMDFVKNTSYSFGALPAQVNTAQNQLENLKSKSSDLTAKSLVQHNNIPADWWKLIVEKHGISYKTFTTHDYFVIFGDRTLNGDIESFTNVIAIEAGDKIERYTIFKSNSATFDTKTNKLTINDCSMDIFNSDSKPTEPVNSYAHIKFTREFTGNGNQSTELIEDIAEVVKK